MNRLTYLPTDAMRLLAIFLFGAFFIKISALAQDSSDPEVPVYAYSSNEPGGIWSEVSIDFDQSSATLSSGQSGPIPIPNAALASDSNTVGRTTDLLISFQWPNIFVLDDYIVGLAFPSEFEFTSGLTVTFSDDQSAPDPELREISITPQTVTLRFRRNFFAPEPGQMSFITLKDVTLPLVAGDYSAVIFIGDTAFNILAGPTFTNEFAVVPETPTSLDPVPGSFEPDIIVIGKPFTFSALAVKGGPARDSLLFSNSRFELYNQSYLFGIDASAQGAGDTISLLSSEINLSASVAGQFFGARFIVDVTESIGSHSDTR
ncbi:MAG: hypothetical protein IIB00_07690, partial [candidate division Zixibacteria bacterium]|nr:hypothetical protein [candidate division Zixibacteria bacterium]